MARFELRRVLSLALVAGAGLTLTGGAAPVSAQSVGPSLPPPNINPAQPAMSGTLVARPFSSHVSVPALCRDKEATVNTATMVSRGMVICTEEGNLVLLQLSRSTGFYARFWGRYGIRRMAIGDHINAWGTLTDHGAVLNPTTAIQDTDIQEAFVDSRDFIAAGGPRLTLFVLSADPRGPVKGMIFASHGDVYHVTLCNGQTGFWEDLTRGKTIEITRSLYNVRLHSYVHTVDVRVVSCR